MISATLPLAEPPPAVVPLASSERKPPLPALTGVRTLLALNIVFFHFTPPHLHYLYPLIDNSFVFVGFFFLLSGYVLTYNYADREKPLLKRDFWIARCARLYPVYLLSLAISLQMLAAEWSARSHGEFWAGLAMAPLLLQGWSPSLATFWNTVAWTLSSELMLYLTFPWLLRLRWPKTASRLVLLLLVLWALGLVPHMVYLRLNPDHLMGPANRYSSGFWIRALKYSPPAYICTFLAGMTLGRLHLRLTMTRLQRTWVALGSLTLLVLFFATAVGHVPYLLLHGGLLVPLFAALALGLSGQNIVASIFAWRPLAWLGQTTYCLYLLHFNTINLIHLYHLPERLHVQALDPWISYAAAFALAIAATFLVERPARRAILARARRPA